MNSEFFESAFIFGSESFTISSKENGQMRFNYMKGEEGMFCGHIGFGSCLIYRFGYWDFGM